MFNNGASREWGDELSNPASWIVNRLHFVPTVVDLGVLTGFRTTHFNMWCTYLRPEELNNVVPANDDGLTIDTGLTLPEDISSFGYYPMSVTAEPEGANEISATYTFNLLNGDSYVLPVEGLRSAVFSHKHNWNSELLESYEWLTGVVTSEDGTEVRSPLRYYPRVSVNHVSLIADEQIMDFRNKMENWHSKSFTVPLWQRQKVLGVQALAAQDEVMIDTSDLGARVGGSILIFQRLGRL